MAVITWPTLKRLLFLERERIENLTQIASLMDENEALQKAVRDGLNEEQRLWKRIRVLESRLEIEDMLREAAE